MPLGVQLAKSGLCMKDLCCYVAEHSELLHRDMTSFVADAYQMLHPIYLPQWKKGEGSILVP